MQHVAIPHAEAVGHGVGRSVNGCQIRGCGIVAAEPVKAADLVRQPAARLGDEPEARLLRGDGPLVDIFLAIILEVHRPPAVGESVAAGTRIHPHVHRRALEMVPHHVGHILDTDLARGLDEERHLALQVVAHRIVQPVRSGRGDFLPGLIEVGELPVAENVEGAPGPGVACPRTAEIQGIVCVAEGELGILAGEVPHLAGEGDDVRRIEAVLGVIQRETRDPGLVGVGADVAVGDAARHPDDTLLLLALADEIHHPDFVGVGDGETLALGRVAVLVG